LSAFLSELLLACELVQLSESEWENLWENDWEHESVNELEGESAAEWGYVWEIVSETLSVFELDVQLVCDSALQMDVLWVCASVHMMAYQ
jgi:hypothetical protein